MKHVPVLYARLSYYHNFIIYILSDSVLILSIDLVVNPEKNAGNRGIRCFPKYPFRDSGLQMVTCKVASLATQKVLLLTYHRAEHRWNNFWGSGS